MVAAVAIFAAVSCNKELEQGNLPAGETVTFEAVADGVDAKAVLDGTTSKWVSGDKITVHNGNKGYEFSTTDEGVKAIFSYTGSDFSGDRFMAVYPAGDYTADLASKTVNAYIPTWQQAQKGTYHKDAALAVAYTDNASLAFKNAAALLKFTVNTDNVTHVVFHGNNSEAVTGNVKVVLGSEGVESVECLETEFTEEKWNETEQKNEEVKVNKYGTWVECYAYHDDADKYFVKGETYYIAVAPQVFEGGVTVKVRIDDGEELVAKTTTNRVATKASTILNLGEISYEAPAVHEWAIAGTFNGWNATANPMELVDGYYVAKNITGLEFTANPDPENTSSDTGFKFVNKGETWRGGEGKAVAGTWAYVWGDGGNIYVDGASADTAYDIYLNPTEGDYGKYVIVAAGASMPEDKPEQPETDASAYGLVGSFQGWDVASPIAMTNSEGGWIVAENVELYKNDEFKFVKDKSWYGTSSVTVIEEGQEFTVQTENGQNMKVAKNGKFNLYFNPTTLNVKVECVDEYTDLTVNITIDNKANWSPLYIYIESDGKAVTPAEGVLVSDNTYAVSGDYIGSTLTCKFISGSKVSEAMNVTVTKNGATVTLEETIIKLKVQLDTDNSKQWWGDNMKIHVWNTGTSFDTSWPGTAMTSEGNYTWSIIVPSELVGKTINYLVHNGNGWQSSDATVTIAAKGNIVQGDSIGIK